jgi:hypothetical protein
LPPTLEFLQPVSDIPHGKPLCNRRSGPDRLYHIQVFVHCSVFDIVLILKFGQHLRGLAEGRLVRLRLV